jgi:hypothetical protein
MHFPAQGAPPNTLHQTDRVWCRALREARLAAIHNLLTVEILELRYSDLDCAVKELEKLVVKDI